MLRRFVSGVAILTIVCSLIVVPSVSAADFRIPRGFREIAAAPGVSLLHRRRDYVHVVTPRDGGRLRVLHGRFLEAGLYGAFLRKDINDWWEEWEAESSRPFSIVNGQFFDTSDPDFAPLAFAIKADGRVYQGYADKTEYPGQKMLLLLGAERHRIVPFYDEPDELLVYREPDILVGLSPRTAKSAARNIPRTFVGLTRDGRTVLFSSSSASQAYAQRVLRSFGADPDQILMLDGGSSSHLVHDGQVLVPRASNGNRRYARELLPQVVGVEAGVE